MYHRRVTIRGRVREDKLSMETLNPPNSILQFYRQDSMFSVSRDTAWWLLTCG
jgi:hypothetical protein